MCGNNSKASQQNTTTTSTKTTTLSSANVEFFRRLKRNNGTFSRSSAGRDRYLQEDFCEAHFSRCLPQDKLEFYDQSSRIIYYNYP